MVDYCERAVTQEEKDELSEAWFHLGGSRHGAVPFVAAMDIEVGRRRRRIYLGEEGAERSGLIRIDWRTAPLSEVFFEVQEGEEYEIVVGNRLVAGRLLRRFVVEKDDTGTPIARRFSLDGPPLFPCVERFGSRETLALDEGQKYAVDLATERPVLIRGEAGFGKTTVALLRLIRLERESMARGETPASLVVVPYKGLAILWEKFLELQGGSSAEVMTYDEWISREAQAVFDGLPSRLSPHTCPSALRVKRHPGIIKLNGAADVTEGQRELDEEYLELSIPRAALLRVFGDIDVLKKMRHESLPALSSRDLEITACRAGRQAEKTTEEKNAHVDAEKLQTLDGRALDAGTPEELAGTVDSEDFTAIFHIMGKQPRSIWDNVVVDEAQELSPPELSLLGQSLKKECKLIIAGDERQQTDPTAFFSGWRTTLAELGAKDAVVVELQESHRCPEPTLKMARELSSGGQPPWPEERFSDGGQPVGLVVSSGFHLVVGLLRWFDAISRADPKGSIGVICADEDRANALFEKLAPRSDLARGFSPNRPSEMAPPALISLSQCKGLEFDYVIVPDVDAATYPDTPQARRRLYVAITRATTGLVLCGGGEPSPLFRYH